MTPAGAARGRPAGLATLRKPVDGIDPRIEAIARAGYERCHPGDSFADLRRRARFTKEDRGLLRQWLDHAEQAASRREADEAGQSPEHAIGHQPEDRQP